MAGSGGGARPAHMAGRQRPLSRTRSPWRAPGTHPARPPAPVACAERWPLPAPGRDSKWRTRPGRAGHRTKERAFPPRPPLLEAAPCAGPARPRGFCSWPWSGAGGGGACAAELPHTVGGDRSWASLALVLISLEFAL